MKLIKLTLCNIGPYKGIHKIDFDSLTSSLFLISGETGAGKSYIFDSICYALYGKTSGDIRETNDMKSRYADLKDTAYIELEFETKGKRYIVYREPAQKRLASKKNANGEYAIKDYPAVAIVTDPTGKKHEKAAAVKQVLEEAIGLPYEQFKMTMMIAQGDFYALINADTKSRQEIFRKILNTAKLDNFTKQLEDEFKKLLGETESIKNRIMTIRNQFDCDDSLKNELNNENVGLNKVLSLLEEELLNEKEEYNAKNLAKDEANKAVTNVVKELSDANTNNTNIENYKKWLEEKAKLDTSAPTVDSYRKALESSSSAQKVSEKETHRKTIEADTNSLKNYIDTNTNTINELKPKLDEAKAKANKIPSLNEENSELTIEIENLRKDIEEYDNYVKESKDLENKNAELIKEQASLKSLNEEKENAEAKKLPHKELAESESKDAEIATIQAELDNIQKEVQELVNKKPLISKYIQQVKDLQQLELDAAREEDNYSKAQFVYSDYNLRYRQSMAGILAKDLEDGVACPVCGATHHIKLATLTDDLKQETLETLEKERDAAKEKMNLAKNNVETKKVEIESSINSIKDLLKRDFTHEDVTSLYNKAVEDKTNESLPFLAKKKELEEFNKARKAAQSAIDLIEKEIEKIDSKIKVSEDKISSLKVDIATLVSKVSSKELRLRDVNKEELTNKKLEEEIKLKSNQSEIDSINNDIKEITNKITAAQSAIDSSIPQLEAKKKELGVIQNELDDLLKSSNFTSVEEALKNKLSEEVSNSYTKTVSEFDSQLTVVTFSLKDCIGKGHDKLSPIDTSLIENKKIELVAKQTSAQDEFTNIHSKYTKNKGFYDQLVDLNSTNSKLMNEYEEVKALYNIASGKYSGAKRINFEVYYQLQVFGEILKVASAKFKTMSNDRYELLPGQPTGGNAQVGLDIDVKDNYNGGIRPVSGLSGGESFQASLALALAFSEVIQIKAGGIELNSMFIDEGFGTLDDQMLDNTKRALLTSGQTANRRIGLISHVEKLEKSIPSKIIVTKSDKGSTIQVVNG